MKRDQSVLTPFLPLPVPSAEQWVDMAILEEMLEEDGPLTRPPQRPKKAVGVHGGLLQQEPRELPLPSQQMQKEEIRLLVNTEAVEEEQQMEDQCPEERSRLEAELLAGIGDWELVIDLRRGMFGGVMFISLSLPLDCPLWKRVKLGSLLILLGTLWWVWNKQIRKWIRKLLDKQLVTKRYLNPPQNTTWLARGQLVVVNICIPLLQMLLLEDLALLLTFTLQVH